MSVDEPINVHDGIAARYEAEILDKDKRIEELLAENLSLKEEIKILKHRVNNDP